MSSADIVDGARDYRIMTRRMVDAIVSMKEYNRFTKGIYGWIGFKTKWIEFENVERIAGETKWSFWKLFKYAIEGIIGFSTMPLSIATWFGLCMSLISFLGILFIIIKKLVYGDPTSGWSSLVCIMLLIAGIQLFCMGVIGQYLERPTLRPKKRPIYIAKKTSDDEDEIMKLIIQIPCYNEEKTLTIALDALPKHIDGIDEIEYLIINDGSKDETVQVAKDWGVNYVVSFPQNKGLAKGFMAGIDACIRNGADIIVNTDADNQYCGEDIEKLVRPILDGEAEIVIGERPIDSIEDFSPLKKKLQHLGSYVVRKASATGLPDAPSGFRAFSKDAAMHLNVINQYTYTLETIVQAGRNRMAITSVPIRTNPELRKSRLFHSMGGYIKKSMLTIIRAFLMYRPLTFFQHMRSHTLCHRSRICHKVPDLLCRR